MTTLECGIIIVILLTVAYFLVTKSNDNLKLEAEALLGSSSGTFDTPAKKALSIYRGLSPSSLNYKDHFNIGRIYQHNLSENNPTNPNMVTAGTYYNRALANMKRAQVNPGAIVFELNKIDEFWDIVTPAEIAEDLAVRQYITNTTKEAAIDNANTLSTNNRLAKIETLVSNSIKHTNDRQNVHDSSVVKDLNKTYEIIKDQNRPFNKAQVLDEIEMRLANNEPALRAFRRIKEGGRVSTYDDTEDNILAQVWQRADHPANLLNAETMREMIIQSLTDCVENDTVVCTGGRSARILGSLTLLDYNPAVGKSLTSEAYKNQIYTEVQQLIEGFVAQSKNNQALKEEAIAYEEGNDRKDSRFNKELTKKITEHIDKYSDKLNSGTIERLKNDCFVYAML